MGYIYAVLGAGRQGVASAFDLVKFGDADTVGEILSEAIGLGLDGITVDLPVNGHNVERIELLGEISLKALG